MESTQIPTNRIPQRNSGVPKKPTVAKGKKKKAKKIPAWAKALIIFGLLFFSLLLGLTIGYSVIGNGSAGDVLSWSTWKHILDLIFG